MIEKVRNTLLCLDRYFQTAFEDIRFCNNLISQLAENLPPGDPLIEEAAELQKKLREDWGQTINNVD